MQIEFHPPSAADDPAMLALARAMRRLVTAIGAAAFAGGGVTLNEAARRMHMAAAEFEHCAEQAREDRHEHIVRH